MACAMSSPLFLRICVRECAFYWTLVVPFVPLVVAVPDSIYTCAEAEPEEALEEAEARRTAVVAAEHAWVVGGAEALPVVEGIGARVTGHVK